MSSLTAPRPEFRLAFGDDAVRFSRAARACEEVPLAAPDLVERLRVIGRERLAARARLTAILPAGTIWEAVLALPRWNPAARRHAVRAAAAGDLGLPPASLAIALGRRRADGTTSVAAIPAVRLAETRAFLAPFGLAPDRIVGAGSLIGFRGRRALAFLPPFQLPQVPALPSVGELRLPAGLLAPLQRPMPQAPMLLGAGGLVAMAALGFALMPGQPGGRLARPVPVAAPPDAGTPAPAPGPALALPRTAEVVAPPPHRPEGLPRLALSPDAAPQEIAALRARPAIPAAGSPPGKVHVTMGTRNLPLTPLAPLPAARRGDEGPRVAELGSAALTPTDAAAPWHRPAGLRDPMVDRIDAALDAATSAAPVSAPRPHWRRASAPPAVRSGSAAAANGAAAATVAGAHVRPEPRPLRSAAAVAAAEGTASADALRPAPRARPQASAPVAAADPAAFVSAGRPEPRQKQAPAAVRVASLAPASDVSALPPAPVAVAVRAAVATAASTPAPARQAPVVRVTPAAAAPARAAPPRAAVVRPTPAAAVPARVASLQPAKPAKVPARSLPLAPMTPVATTPRAAPVVKVVPAQPKQVAARKPVKPQRTARADPAREKVGLSRRGASLIGIFGDADGRYALVQTGRGKVTKVKAGDSLDGAVVAAIGKDSLQLDGRHDTLLRLPD